MHEPTKVGKLAAMLCRPGEEADQDHEGDGKDVPAGVLASHVRLTLYASEKASSPPPSSGRSSSSSASRALS